MGGDYPTPSEKTRRRLPTRKILPPVRAEILYPRPISHHTHAFVHPEAFKKHQDKESTGDTHTSPEFQTTHTQEKPAPSSNLFRMHEEIQASLQSSVQRCMEESMIPVDESFFMVSGSRNHRNCLNIN